MKRETKIIPAWDCICGPCGRPDCPGHGAVGDLHGRSNEDWIYSVSADDGLTVLSLSVRTGNYHESTPQWIKDGDEERRLAGRLPSAYDITLHCAFQTDSDGCGSSPAGCVFLGGKPCHAHHTSALGADELWKAHGEPGAQSPERMDSFWVALEERFRVLDHDARARRVKACPDCPPVCNTCGGTCLAPDPFPGFV